MKASRQVFHRFPALLALTALAACAAPTWKTVEAGRYAIHVEEGMQAGLAQRLAAWTASDLDAVARVIHADLPERGLDVYSGLPAVQGGHLRTVGGEVGRYQASPGGPGHIELVADGRLGEMRGTLRHEIAHHLMQDLGYAEWLNEGLAEYAAYELATPPLPEDLHHLLHAGLVVAGWGGGLEVRTMEGDLRRIRPELWLPELPEVLRMDYDDYSRLVLHRTGQDLQPEFHSISHLLVRVLMQRGGADAPWRCTRLVEQGRDPWAAYLEAADLAGEAETLAALSDSLEEAVGAFPAGDRVAAQFANCRCLLGTIPEDMRFGKDRPASVQPYPSGPMVATFKR